MKILRIALPRPNVDSAWDYFLPGDLDNDVQVGMRVLVTIGNSSETGYVVEIDSETSTSKSLKPVIEILDNEPIINQELLNLTRWASEYYVNSWGEMIKAALPAGINVKQDILVFITSSGKEYYELLQQEALRSEKENNEIAILDLLVHEGPIKRIDVGKQYDGGSLSSLKAKGHIEIREQRSGRNLQKSVKYISLAHNLPENYYDILDRSKQRKKAFNVLSERKSPVQLSKVKETLGVSSAVIESMVKAGLVEKYDQVVRRNPFKNLDVEMADPHPLTTDQARVFQPVNEALASGGYKSFLLHGITGSGKTEIYLHLAQKTIQQGKSVLVLIPELSLTPQFVRRYYSVFGEELAVLHSGLPLGERTDEWNRVREGKAKIVLGTRLSVFAPLKEIGLIVVDEEHDQSYKQDDNPVFNARDLAIIRAQMNNAVCLLGSATPSLESLHNAKSGKSELLKLKKRVHNRPLPKINLVDLRQPEHERKTDQLLPDTVLDSIKKTLERNDQTLIMVGRKGFAPFVICRSCGNRFECKTCSISLSWHEKLEKLKCHYCGRMEVLPEFCPKCGSSSVETLGIGSAKLEQYLNSTFPDASIERMDRDVITRPQEYQLLLDKFRKREVDILVGTQMLAKGHDYPRVTNVVALGLDSILNLPDFRHAERLFQLVTQISGRSGRGELPGQVYVMTYRPDHYAFKAALSGDFSLFLEKELVFRKSLRYPPAGYLGLVTIEDFKRDRCLAKAQWCAETLLSTLGSKAILLGPNLAPYARLKSKWRYQLFIKSLDRMILNKALTQLRKEFTGRSVLKINVDPVTVM